MNEKRALMAVHRKHLPQQRSATATWLLLYIDAVKVGHYRRRSRHVDNIHDSYVISYVWSLQHGVIWRRGKAAKTASTPAMKWFLAVASSFYMEVHIKDLVYSATLVFCICETNFIGASGAPTLKAYWVPYRL